jgi:hypothetical protein
MTNFNEAGEGTEGAPKPEPHRRLLELTDDSLGPRSMGPSKFIIFAGGTIGAIGRRILVSDMAVSASG